MTADDAVTQRKPSVRALREAQKAEREAEESLLDLVLAEPRVVGWKALRKVTVQFAITAVLGARERTRLAKAADPDSS